jgi:hypothetical protein
MDCTYPMHYAVYTLDVVAYTFLAVMYFAIRTVYLCNKTDWEFSDTMTTGSLQRFD